LASHYLKLLKDGITWNGVENVCNISWNTTQLGWTSKMI
jgi:hypothetical protein